MKNTTINYKKVTKIDIKLNINICKRVVNMTKNNT